MWNIIKEAWHEPAIHEVWKYANEFQLIDSAKYFYDNLDRVSQMGYIPSVDDILHSRQMTTGICEIEWDSKNFHFKMTDVVGQRNHRNKWIHCFDAVTAVIFCVALSEYDQTLREDDTTNRMHESLQLFDSLVNSEWFYKTPFVIFFNKRDIFDEKIKTKSLKCCWEEYNGSDGDAAKEFIKMKFLELDQKRQPKRQIYHHFTCATDTNNIKTVYDIVVDILLKDSIGTVFG